MNQGNGNRVARDIESIPKLKKQLCNLSKTVETLSYVENITNFRLNGLNLEIEFIDSQGNTQILSENISSLSESEIKDNVLNYDELLNVSSPELYQFAYVRESQGTEWQSSIGIGKYYGSGLYMWNGTEWVEDDTNIFTQLETLIQALNNEITDRTNADANLQTQIDSNDVDITNLQNDLSQETTDRQAADTTLQSNIDAEQTARQAADTALLGQIQSNDIDIANLQNDKRDNTSQKNSIEDDGGDLQLVGDEENPGSTKVYGTNTAGVKGWYDQTGGGDQAFVNQSALYKAFSDVTPGINNSLAYTTLSYKPAVAGTYDNTIFAPVANGVQLLVDLENLTLVASVFVTSDGQRTGIGVSVAIDGVPSTVEATGYIRAASGHNEELFQVVETFDSLSAGTVITAQSKRNAGPSNNTQSIEDKGILSVFGFVPDTPGTIIGFPTPIITSISTT